MSQWDGKMMGDSERSPDGAPPVTKATLSELDVPWIVFNPKLRHDVNFDPDLHFRPNLDGESGRKKAQKANDFWNRLQTQLEAFMADPIRFEKELGGREWCLQTTLQAIGEVLGTLVPPEDRSAVEEVLNVELLMQQFRKGVAGLEKLALWLASTLKSHCAPMRDQWVDEMVNQLTLGNRDGNVAGLVQGLRSLLGVLEAMKLDVTNHQIRCLRPLLIQDTVEFELTFFMKKIALRKIDIAEAHAWFQALKQVSDNSQPQSNTPQGGMWEFFRGYTELLSQSTMELKITNTSMFDKVIELFVEILEPHLTRYLRPVSIKEKGEIVEAFFKRKIASLSSLLLSAQGPLIVGLPALAFLIPSVEGAALRTSASEGSIAPESPGITNPNNLEAKFLQSLLKFLVFSGEATIALFIASPAYWICRNYCKEKANRLQSSSVMLFYLGSFYYLREEPDAGKGLLAGLAAGGAISLWRTFYLGIKEFKVGAIYVMFGIFLGGSILYLGYRSLQSESGGPKLDVLVLPALALAFMILEIVVNLYEAMNGRYPELQRYDDQSRNYLHGDASQQTTAATRIPGPVISQVTPTTG